MALAAMNELLLKAQRGKYIVCYCESWNLESFQAVLEAAENSASPVIAGFNGGFLMHRDRDKQENLTYYAGLKMGLKEAGIPAAFLLNESDDFSQLMRAIELGFNAIMVENEHLLTEDYLPLVKKVVRQAHQAGASVEAAVGRLADGAGHVKAEATDAMMARRFVEETGIDALGVAVGNMHILTQGTTSIDLDALELIHRQVTVPLVLHGGTGIQLQNVRSYVDRGVAKINFGTALKQAYLAAIRKSLARYREPMDPHPFLGTGGEQDVLVAGRKAVREKVEGLMLQCGSNGKAKLEQVSGAGTARSSSYEGAC